VVRIRTAAPIERYLQLTNDMFGRCNNPRHSSRPACLDVEFQMTGNFAGVGRNNDHAQSWTEGRFRESRKTVEGREGAFGPRHSRWSYRCAEPVDQAAIIRIGRDCAQPRCRGCVQT
jgi:hypothetical protein